MFSISRLPRAVLTGAAGFFIALLAVILSAPQPAGAQTGPSARVPAVGVPGFWDPRRRPERPEVGRLTAIRFLTEDDYPPFNFRGPDGQPMGFNVDLARALCEELAVTCTIQVRRFDTLIEALEDNRGDAIVASLAITPALRERVAFTDRYFRMPARFVARKEFPPDDVTPEAIAGRRVAVVADSAHEAYLRAFFAETALQSHEDLESALAALQGGDVELVFADGVALSFWLNGTQSEGCCGFRGGPFIESRYFGEGIGIAVARDNDLLRMSLNYALFRLWERGIMADLYLRYFPVGVF